MNTVFLSAGWEDYIYWQKNNKENLKKINDLIKEIKRTPFKGTGKPESLKNNLKGWWSRRITHELRLVYRVSNTQLYILQCRRHY